MIVKNSNSAPGSGRTVLLAIVHGTFSLRLRVGIGDSQEEHSAFYARPIQTVRPYYVQLLETISP